MLKATPPLMALGKTRIHKLNFTLNRILNGKEHVNSPENINGLTIHTMTIVANIDGLWTIDCTEEL